MSRCSRCRAERVFSYFPPAEFVLALPLAGSIPPELGKLGVLQRLSLSNNQLSGEF